MAEARALGICGQGATRTSRATRPNGADFHLIVVHLDSGTRDRDYQNRRDAIDQLDDLEIGGTPLASLGNGGAGDNDIIVLGDWNTMGRREAPEVSARREIEIFDGELAPEFTRLTPIPACSEYYRGVGGLLDHVVRSQGMEESAVTTRVTGYCAVRDCQPFGGNPTPDAYETLSDHCPLVFEIRDEDRD